MVTRRSKYIIYLKSSEKIGDFLGLVGATSSYMNFESVRIDRDFINSINRLENCEIANEVKSMNAANQQVADIQYIQSKIGLELLDEKTRNIALLRLDNPELNLNELANEYASKYGAKISKSGLHHRFKKIKEEVNRLKAME